MFLQDRIILSPETELSVFQIFCYNALLHDLCMNLKKGKD
jgi:hypothetical protein